MKVILFFSFIFVLIFLTGCAPVIQKSKGVTDECTPSNLEIFPNNSRLELKWDTNCEEDRLIMGYYIYLEKKPIEEQYLASVLPKKIKPFNLTPYPGDTDPEVSYETMTIDNLENGAEYYVSVRTVFPDNTISVSSNQVNTICRPEGSFDLAYRYSAQNDGFSFNKLEPVRSDADENDFYFFNKDGMDFISSPHRLNGFLRKTLFYSLGKTKDIYQYPNLSLDYEAVDKTPVLAGESYLIKTADGNYAKIRIESASGEGKQRMLSIKFIYQTKPGLVRF